MSMLETHCIAFKSSLIQYALHIFVLIKVSLVYIAATLVKYFALSLQWQTFNYKVKRATLHCIQILPHKLNIAYEITLTKYPVLQLTTAFLASLNPYYNFQHQTPKKTLI